jgi:hypothetical protein
VVAVVLTSLIVSVKSVITLWIVLVKSLARLCRALATPLNVLAALLAVVPALGLAAGAARALVAVDRLPSVGPIGKLPTTGAVDGTVRSSSLSRVRGGRHQVGRLCRWFPWRPFVQWRRSRIRILLLLSRRASGFPVAYHAAFTRRPEKICF